MYSKQTLHIFTCESLNASSDPVLDPPDGPPDTENGLTGVNVVQVVDGHQLLVTKHHVILALTAGSQTEISKS